ncbi:MAG: hypothetical protein EDM05_019860 [Leptolyngbya sp. IPPAS B-1204]|uniref:Uncharacterized protein n=1 Tax=Leptolyngbya sp. NK1-12 TaxID=2547451 RepID=A0AA97AH57_9CYAN|nr:hypothetical protein [Leptolyngbya sp. NK1-12]MBF2050667.1 hypothetical protein [Elainella sp. C42_A2020_010]WNZ22426.1 hypothetical protein HJG54_05825 [Leptolyngbya sp. NK1-12]
MPSLIVLFIYNPRLQTGLKKFISIQVKAITRKVIAVRVPGGVTPP